MEAATVCPFGKRRPTRAVEAATLITCLTRIWTVGSKPPNLVMLPLTHTGDCFRVDTTGMASRQLKGVSRSRRLGMADSDAILPEHGK